MQINQAPEAAAANRARIDADRLHLIRNQEKRIYRIEASLAQCRRPEAIARARRKLEAAKRRLAYVQINGSLPSKARRGNKLQGFAKLG